jgi:hypothetical protein
MVMTIVNFKPWTAFADFSILNPHILNFIAALFAGMYINKLVQKFL